MAKLESIEGIGAKQAEKLAGCGIKNQKQLLDACGKKAGRVKLAKDSAISEKLILKWTNRADLARVKGIGEEYADLLEFSGVDSVPALARRNADNLYKKMTEVNEKKKLVRSLPTLKKIQGWIENSKTLERAVFH